MSKTIKYYYTRPIDVNVVFRNPILNKTISFKVCRGRRYTIAVVYDDDDRTIKFGLATCNPSDNFCKKVGQNISIARAFTEPFSIIKNFNGRRNDYADLVMKIIKNKELVLLKKDYPNMFNPKCFIN